MKFSERSISNIPIFELEGKIMGDQLSQALCDRLTKLISEGAKDIILDFSRVQWFNSLAIGFMIGCLKQLRAKGGDLYLTGTQGRVAYYLTVTKLDTQIEICQGVNEALGKIRSTQVAR
ncbi:STAS domain-containing protein [bacterium]|nr:STAS domain-containing protein [bacterium]